MTDPISVSIPEGARLLGVGRSTFYELINAKEISLVKIGRRSVVTFSSLKRYIDSKSGEAV